MFVLRLLIFSMSKCDIFMAKYIQISSLNFIKIYILYLAKIC